MQGFVTTDRQLPDKRSADERRRDFDEIYRSFDPRSGAAQASRCAQCGVPFCQVHCPLQNNIPDWLRLTAEGRMEDAYRVASATNTFPEICGRICPQDKLCEGNCVIEQAGFGTVTIGAVEKYITETAFDMGWVKPRLPEQELAQSAGIIGAGPAGLAAAEILRARGYRVTVYDRYDRIGGLLTYGIPNFKLEKYVVARRHELLLAQGIEFVPDFAVGRDATLDDLRARHDAVLIATGVYRARELDLAEGQARGVVAALDYLIHSNRMGFGDGLPDPALNAAGKKVVVVGGGDTAMDCVRTAIRQGAAGVTCLYRRDRVNMPGSRREVAQAEEEGVVFEWLAAPAGLIVENGQVSGLRACRMALGEKDRGGRHAFYAVDGSDFTLEADLVIKALGFEAEDLPRLFDAPGLEVTAQGTVQADFKTLMTSLPGVFAAGDIVRGASLVVWAIRDGRDAAEAMHGWLQQAANRMAAE
jgi:glutamate synthase (NADPH/NADH) small chain